MFRIEITEMAKRETQEVYDWMWQRSSASANRWLSGLEKTIETLTNNPGRCPLARESDAFAIPVRQLLYGKRSRAYRVLFQVKGDTVYVLHVRHGAMANVSPEE